jgi:hypothetical protein
MTRRQPRHRPGGRPHRGLGRERNIPKRSPQAQRDPTARPKSQPNSLSQGDIPACGAHLPRAVAGTCGGASLIGRREHVWTAPERRSGTAPALLSNKQRAQRSWVSSTAQDPAELVNNKRRVAAQVSLDCVRADRQGYSSVRYPINLKGWRVLLCGLRCLAGRARPRPLKSPAEQRKTHGLTLISGGARIRLAEQRASSQALRSSTEAASSDLRPAQQLL